MMRVLTVALSVWAASVAADHGTEEVLSGPSYAGPIWAGDFKAQIAPCLNTRQQGNGPIAFVAVAFEMGANARPVVNSIRLASPSVQAGEAQGLEAARRAIVRCGQAGYDLPLDLFSQWQYVEINFPYFVQLN